VRPLSDSSTYKRTHVYTLALQMTTATSRHLDFVSSLQNEQYARVHPARSKGGHRHGEPPFGQHVSAVRARRPAPGRRANVYDRLIHRVRNCTLMRGRQGVLKSTELAGGGDEGEGSQR
jgi:hypothetical protein